MNRLLTALLMTLLAPVAFAHGGEDHGEGAAQTSAGAGAMTTSALTRRYEVVLKHAPVRGGQPYRATLYLAFFETNLPVRGARLTIEEPGVTGRPFVVRATSTPGVYTVERAAGFARDGRFSVAVRVAGPVGTDLALLTGVYVGPVETPAAVAAPATEVASEGPPWTWIFVVLALGVVFVFWLVRMARKRRTHPSVDEAGRPEAPVQPPSGRPLYHEPSSTLP